MDNQMFPEEIVQFSAEGHFHKNNVRGKPVYFAAIILLICSFIALPIIKVDVTFSTRGILRTAENSTRITVPVSGMISRNLIRPNCFVNRDDTLIILHHEALENEIGTTLAAKLLIEGYINDLKRLLAGKSARETDRYKHAASEYQHETDLLKNELHFIKDNYQTSKELYEGGYIARMDYESVRNQLISAETRLDVKQKEFQSRWQGELSNYTLEHFQLSTKLAHLLKTKDLHYLKAPVEGFIVDYRDLTAGSYLSANDLVARIVPNHELVATCMISPDKISRISVGQQVRLNIDTYPGTAFGYIEGTVTSIPEDASVYADIPGFPVICSIQQEVQHRSGDLQVALKSGMTFTGLFILSKRSIWKLLAERGEKLLFSHYSNTKDGKKQVH